MAGIDRHFYDIGFLDTLAARKNPVNRLDPRAKLITTMVFIVAVVSFNKYAISAMIPFFIYLFALVSAGNLPAAYLMRKVLLVSPFAVLIGVFNPLMDRQVLLHIGPVAVSGGWVSFCSILLRFVLTVTAVLILIATTGFHSVCYALERIGVPKPFVVQLMFLYRYLFVLTEEAARTVRARALRSFGSRGMGFQAFSSMIGHLLLRTLDRAQRVHLAMCCRGFDGRLRVAHSLKIGPREIVFMAGWSSLFFLFRYENVPLKLGALITGLFT